MNATTALRDAGQRLWLDPTTRQALESGALQRYIDQYGVTGVTLNRTVATTPIGDAEEFVHEPAVADAQRVADLLRSIWDTSYHLDGWLSIDLPPDLAYNAAATIKAGLHLHARVDRPNIFIKIPATQPGLIAIEELIAAGVPINATLIFDPRQQRAAEASYIRGLGQRHRRGQTLRVASVASVLVSSWDRATNPFLPPAARNRVGLALAWTTYRAHLQTLASRQWALLASSGADPQRPVWAGTTPADPRIPPTHYVDGLPPAATISTMSETTLDALGRRDGVGAAGPDTTAAQASAVAALDALSKRGLDAAAVADALQQQGVQAFAADRARLLDTAHTRPSGWQRHRVNATTTH